MGVVRVRGPDTVLQAADRCDPSLRLTTCAPSANSSVAQMASSHAAQRIPSYFIGIVIAPDLGSVAGNVGLDWNRAASSESARVGRLRPPDRQLCYLPRRLLIVGA